MLTLLSIRNFAIIDELNVEFEEGFNVLTGETGAGKSILVQGVHLLLGGRAHADMIRTDKDTAEVEGTFRLPADSPQGVRLEEMELADGDSMHVRRIVSRSGRNRAFLNGRSVGLGLLSEMTRGLVDISGQHEHVGLTDEDTHRGILDAFGDLGDLADRVRIAVGRLRSVESDLKELAEREKQQAEREDFLRFHLERIDALNPVSGEDEQLQREKSRLKNREKLDTGLRNAVSLLYEKEGSAVELLGKTVSLLDGLVPFDPDLKEIGTALEGVLRQVEDLSHELEVAAQDLEADPSRLEEVEERLGALKTLLRSHGPDVQSLIEKRDGMARELESLSDLANRRAGLEKKLAKYREEALDLAAQLSKKRRKVAARLGRHMVTELETLAMPGAKVEVEVRSGEELQEWGVDQVRFLLSANPGEQVKPLSRVASGGELSRVLLALKSVLLAIDHVPSYVFDEVDSGVGGKVAGIIGEKLSAVSTEHQVICITHLPQIAAWASWHFVVRKRMEGSRTVSEVSRLNATERVEEVARMVGGARLTDKAIQHAEDLLKSAKKRSGSRL